MSLPDYTQRDVTYHDLSRLDGAPPRVHELVASFLTPTHSSSIFENIKQTGISLENAELWKLAERVLSESEPSKSASDDAEIDGMEHLIPDVLSAVNSVQHQLAKSQIFGGSATNWTAIAVNFIETCVREACAEAFILQDAPFALPRPPSTSSDPLSRFLPRYSAATFAFLPFAGSEHEAEVVNDNQDESEAVAEELISRDISEVTRSPSSNSLPSSWPSDYDWTLEQFLKISAQRQRAPPKHEDTRSLSSHYALPDASTDPSDGPETSRAPETELLARQGAGKLCVLVVSPPQEIAMALSSAVYHRLACGVSQPVLGLVTGRDSPTVRLAVAWAEHTDVLTDDLPGVHIALSALEPPDARCLSGLFRTDSVESMLLLAISIVSLGRRFDSEAEVVNNGSDSIPPERPAWRADRVRAPEEPEASSSKDFIYSWLQHTPPPPPAATNNAAMARPRSETIKPRPRKAHSERKPSDNDHVVEPSQLSLSPLSPTIHSPAFQVEENVADDGFGADITAMSMSAMAKAKVEGRDGRVADRSWQWALDRRVVTRTIPSPWVLRQLSANSNISPKLNKLYTAYRPCWEYVYEYYEYISLASSDFMLILPHYPRYNHHMRPLVEELKTFWGELPSAPSTPAWKQISSDLCTFSRTHMHDILRVVANARYNKRKEGHSAVPEAHWRRYWDLLLEYALDNLEGPVEVATLYEKKLLMPRNDAYDEVVGYLAAQRPVPRATVSSLRSTFEAHKTLLEVEDLAYEQLQSLPGFDDEGDAENLSVLTTATLDDHQKEAEAEDGIFATPFDPQALRSRHLRDPRSGKCDAVGMIRFPGFFEGFGTGQTQTYFEDLHRYGLLPHPILPPKKQKSPISVDEDDIRGIYLGRKTKIENSRDVFASVRRASRCNKKGVLLTDLRRGQALTSAQKLNRSEQDLVDATRQMQLGDGDQGQTRWSRGTMQNVPDIASKSKKGPKGASTSNPPPRTKPSLTTAAATSNPPPGRPPKLPARKKNAEKLIRRISMSDLHLPFMPAEYKKENVSHREQGMNQLRAYLVAALKFLHALGIIHFLVWGFVTEGTVGTVVFAWCEEAPDTIHEGPVIHVMERNALVFDIADPCDALNFAVFLFRLSRIYAPKLKRRVEEAREEILRNRVKIPEWTQEHQHPTPPREKRFGGQGAEIDLTDEDEDEDDTEVAEVAGEVAGESTQEDEDSEDSKED